MGSPVEASPVEASPVETPPVAASPVEASPVQASPVDEIPVEATSVEATPVEASTVQVSVVEEASPVEEVSIAEDVSQEKIEETFTIIDAKEEVEVESAPVKERVESGLSNTSDMGSMESLEAQTKTKIEDEDSFSDTDIIIPTSNEKHTEPLVEEVTVEA